MIVLSEIVINLLLLRIVLQMGGDITKERSKEELIDNEYGIWLYFKKSIIISTTLEI